MTIRQLIHIALTTGNLDADVKISGFDDITSIRFDSDRNLIIGASGYDQDKLVVKTEIEVKSLYPYDTQIFQRLTI